MRIFYILFIALLTTVQLKSQDKSNLNQDQNTEIKITKFYPNPATSLITFEFKKEVDNGKNYSFQVYNFPGKKMYEAENISSKTVIDLSNFFRGIYVYQLKDQNGRIIESGKFMVIK
ncbi:MAG TPA: T9SS type A sorting domain-containing protein [Puia sp.]|nr:T9SS type A sorting domain-containing protein [Puia sp.]